MKEELLYREFDRLVEGRLKRLSELNLRVELDSRENVPTIFTNDGEEIFGESKGPKRLEGVK